MPDEMSLLQRLGEELDRAYDDPADWLKKLQNIRARTDEGHGNGTLSLSEWQALVSKSAHVQDAISRRMARED